MEFKNVNVSDSVSVPVPLGLSPDEEANYIAHRIAFVNFDELEAQCAEALKSLDEGKLTPFDKVLEELEREYADQDTEEK
jgi:hypothetical protein